MGWKTLMLLVAVLAGIGSAYGYDWYWESGAKIAYFDPPIAYSPVIDNGTINTGETVTSYYTANSTLGGAHFKIEWYNENTVKATITLDSNEYVFSGCLWVGNGSRTFSLFPMFSNELSETVYIDVKNGGWSPNPPVETPIPPLAIILALMTIPAIVLRKITK